MAVVVVVVAVVSVVVRVAVVVVAVVEPVYVVVVDVDVVVVLVSLVVVLVAVVLVTVDVVTVDVVVAMQLRCRCAANGWCCPGGHCGHVLCVVSLGMYSVSFGHGWCVSHAYALAVGVALPPQLPALYSCSPVHCRLSHAWQIYPLPSLPQVPARYCSWAHAAFSHELHANPLPSLAHVPVRTWSACVHSTFWHGRHCLLLVVPPQLPTRYCSVLHCTRGHVLQVSTLAVLEYVPTGHVLQVPFADVFVSAQ